jgi:hypothetical protein
MVRELQNVMIIPKRPLRYVRESELKANAEMLLGTGTHYSRMFDKHGERLRDPSNPERFARTLPQFDGFFVPLREGESYHPESRGEIYRAADPVPVLMVENNPLHNGVIISIHMDVARMNPEADLRSAIMSLSRFCTKDTKVPMVTKRGFEVITIPKNTASRVSIPIHRQEISMDSSESKEMREENQTYLSGIFGALSLSEDERLRQESTILRDNTAYLLKTRYSKAINSGDREFVLPVGVSSDEFFRHLHLEHCGFSHGETTPRWLHPRAWGSEELNDKLFRLQEVGDLDGIDEELHENMETRYGKLLQYVTYLGMSEDIPKLTALKARYPQDYARILEDTAPEPPRRTEVLPPLDEEPITTTSSGQRYLTRNEVPHPSIEVEFE